MATVALPSFAPAAFASGVGTSASQTAALPASGSAIVVVTNYGNATAFVALAASVTASTGLAVLPNSSVALTIAGTQLSFIGLGALLNIVSGN